MDILPSKIRIKNKRCNVPVAQVTNFMTVGNRKQQSVKPLWRLLSLFVKPLWRMHLLSVKPQWRFISKATIKVAFIICKVIMKVAFITNLYLHMRSSQLSWISKWIPQHSVSSSKQRKGFQCPHTRLFTTILIVFEMGWFSHFEM